MNAGDEQVMVYLTRMDGKLDRVGDAVTRQEVDMRELRTEQREQSASLGTLIGLNIQERFVALGGALKLLEERVDKCERTDDVNEGEKKGIATAVRIIYATCSLVGLSTIAIVAKLFGVGGT